MPAVPVPSVTAGGLVFVGATNDRRFRAFDAKTGKEIWTMRIDANANANPMSYPGKSGKQYVAIVAGGNVSRVRIAIGENSAMAQSNFTPSRKDQDESDLCDLGGSA